jgi:hypothetical protein
MDGTLESKTCMNFMMLLVAIRVCAIRNIRVIESEKLLRVKK